VPKGRAATLQAVTRVKPEQASKVKLWMPTRLLTGEGRANVRGRSRISQTRWAFPGPPWWSALPDFSPSHPDVFNPLEASSGCAVARKDIASFGRWLERPKISLRGFGTGAPDRRTTPQKTPKNLGNIYIKELYS
jgi:hypothetical protein